MHLLNFNTYAHGTIQCHVFHIWPEGRKASINTQVLQSVIIYDKSPAESEILSHWFLKKIKMQA